MEHRHGKVSLKWFTVQFICLTLFSISSIPTSAPARGGDSAAVCDVRTSLFEGSILRAVTLNIRCPGNPLRNWKTTWVRSLHLCTSGFDLCIAVLLAKFGTKWPAKRIMSRTKPSYLRESVIKSHSHVGAWAPKIELCASLKSAKEEAAQPARAAVQRKAMENTLTWPTCAKCFCVTMYFSSQQGLQTYLKHQELIGPTTQLPLRQRFPHGPRLWKQFFINIYIIYLTESYWYMRIYNDI